MPYDPLLDAMRLVLSDGAPPETPIAFPATASVDANRGLSIVDGAPCGFKARLLDSAGSEVVPGVGQRVGLLVTRQYPASTPFEVTGTVEDEGYVYVSFVVPAGAMERDERATGRTFYHLRAFLETVGTPGSRLYYPAFATPLVVEVTGPATSRESDVARAAAAAAQAAATVASTKAAEAGVSSTGAATHADNAQTAYDQTVVKADAATTAAATAVAAASSAAAIQVALRGYPFAPSATGTTGAVEAKIRGLVLDLRITGAPTADLTYVLAYARRGPTQWRLLLYSKTSAGATAQVADYVATASPEGADPSQPVSVVLSPVGASGISAVALVRWSALAADETISGEVNMTVAPETWESTARAPMSGLVLSRASKRADASRLRDSAHPFTDDAKGTDADATDRIRRFLRALRITGAPVGGMLYRLAYLRRNEAGAWTFYIYAKAAGGVLVGMDSVLVFTTTSNPEPATPGALTTLAMSASNSSGLSAVAVVDWSALESGKTLSNQADMYLSPEVFEAYGYNSLGYAALREAVVGLQMPQKVFADDAAGTPASNRAKMVAFARELHITGTRQSGGRYLMGVAQRDSGGLSRLFVYFNPTSTSTYTPVLTYSVSGDPGAVTQAVTLSPMSSSGLSGTAVLDWSALAPGTVMSSQLQMWLSSSVWPDPALTALDTRVTALEASASAVVTSEPVLWKGRMASGIAALAGVPTGGVARILLLGDSWFERLGIAEAFRLSLTARYGSAGAGVAWFASDYNPATFSAITKSATSYDNTVVAGKWTRRDQDIPGRGVNIMHLEGGEAGLFAQMTVTGTDLWLHLCEGTGSLRWNVDGGAWTTVDTSTLGGYTRLQIVTGGSNVARVVRVETTTAGLVRLVGLEARTSGAGVWVVKAGNGSSKATDFLAAPAVEWQAQLAALAPDAVFILLGTNDLLANVAASQFVTNITALVGRVKAARPNASVAMVVPGDNGTPAWDDTRALSMRAYSNAIRAASGAMGVSVVDLRVALGLYATANAYGVYADPSHLSDKGGGVAAAWMTEALRVG